MRRERGRSQRGPAARELGLERRVGVGGVSTVELFSQADGCATRFVLDGGRYGVHDGNAESPQSVGLPAAADDPGVVEPRTAVADLDLELTVHEPAAHRDAVRLLFPCSTELANASPAASEM